MISSAKSRAKVNKMSIEQMNLFDIEDRNWQEEISALCERLVDLHQLPKNSLYLAKKYG